MYFRVAQRGWHSRNVPSPQPRAEYTNSQSNVCLRHFSIPLPIHSRDAVDLQRFGLIADGKDKPAASRLSSSITTGMKRLRGLLTNHFMSCLLFPTRTQIIEGVWQCLFYDYSIARAHSRQ